MTDVRPGRASDLPAINDIYNHYIATSHCTFDVEPKNEAWRIAWFERFALQGRYRLFVAERDQLVVGYACSGPFRDKQAYEPSVETSVYTAPACAGGGVGSALYAALLDEIAREDVHRLYAGIALPNDPSIALHERFGFRRVALFTEQGRKFGRYWDVAWYEKPV